MNIIEWLFGKRRPDPDPTPTPTPSLVRASDVYPLINAGRMRAGLPPLVPDSRLEAAAARRIARLAARGILDHAGFAVDICAAVPEVKAEGEGEVLAAGQTSAAQVVSDWLADAPHRAELLGGFSRMGAGAAVGRNGMLFWCVDFAEI